MHFDVMVARALELAFDHDLEVKTVTCDGTSTNFSTMKRFGCKIGNQKELLDGTFSFSYSDLDWVSP